MSVDPLKPQVLDLEDFVNTLFSQPPKAPNSCAIDISFMDDSTMNDFLHDLFILGKKKKFGDTKSLNMTHFGIIREYIQSIGYNTELLAYEQDTETKDISGILLKFTKLS